MMEKEVKSILKRLSEVETQVRALSGKATSAVQGTITERPAWFIGLVFVAGLVAGIAIESSRERD